MQSLVRRSFTPFALAALTALVSVSADAQVQPAPGPQPPPSVSATAMGDARIVPDRAMLSVAVESQAASAAKAGADNAARQTRVIDALKAAGIAAAQIRTSGYNVFPEYAQGDGRAPRITGYRAHNSVQVEVRDIAAVGKVIDAVLAAGANNIGAVSLFASNTDPARKEALQKEMGLRVRADVPVIGAVLPGAAAQVGG